MIYTRISVTSEESVSIERQLQSAEQYAAARGWEVVGRFRDDGVSATHNKPEDRSGWRDLLGSPTPFDVVIVWKVDRLARRVLDFLHADEALQERGAGIVAVEQPIDMTTPEGRGYATVLAVFGEMEAAAIAARVKAARDYLIRAGRVVGGTVPYGWRSVKNPNGKGFILVQDPDRIDYVRGMVDRVLAGGSIYSVSQWLDEVGAPLPTVSQANRKREGWHYGTVERMLRNPLLAGMTPHNPGNKTKQRGTGVLRDDNGLPVVDESVAIMTPEEWRVLLSTLDNRQTPQRKPRVMKSRTSALLSGMVRCADCTDDDGEAQRMWRGTVNGREGYYCPQCRQSISHFEDTVVAEFLRQKGDHTRWSLMKEVREGGAVMLPEIEERLAELAQQLRTTDDDGEADDLMRQMSALRALRRQKRTEAATVRLVPVRSEQDFAEDWAEALSVEERRAILDDALVSVTVRRGRPGRRTAESLLARLEFAWKDPKNLGPAYVPADDELAQWAEDDPYGAEGTVQGR